MPLVALPEIRHRHSVAEVAATFPNAEAAFNAGNHVIAASLAEPGSALRGAALVMLGAYRRGLALLDAAPVLTPMERCTRALAQWQTGAGEAARAEMSRLAESHPGEPLYAACHATLARTEWNVLLFTNPFPRSVAAFREADRHSHFRVHTAGFDDGCDIRLRHDRPLAETLAAAGVPNPDLALNLTSYGTLHQDFGQLSCPKICFVSDLDYFLFNRHSLAQHDIFVSNGPVEHFELRQMHRRAVHTYYTLDLDYQLNLDAPADSSDKRFDVALSGSSLVPYMREKAQLVMHLLDLPDDLAVRVLQGFMPPADYAEFIRHSRLMPMSVRFSDLLNTRIIEAVQHGCDGLHLDGNLWPELLGLERHTHPYRYNSLEADIRAALEACDTSAIDSTTQAAIRDLLPPSPEREIRFLRHFAFLSCLPRAAEARPPARASGATGILLELQQRTPESIDRYYHETIAHFDAGQTAYDGIKALNARIYRTCMATDERAKRDVIDVGRRLVSRHPDHLVLRFNYARFLYHHVAPDEAAPHFAHIVRERERLVLVEDEDDVLNYHYHNEFFPFMHYQDQVQLKLAEAAGETGKEWIEPRQVIASTAYHYLADWHFWRKQTADSIDCASQGITLDSGNYNLLAALVRICWRGWEESGDRGILGHLLACFDRAVDGFPGHFRELAWYAWKSIEVLSDEALGKRLLQLWYRFAARLLISDAPPLPAGQEAELLAALRRYRHDLPPPIAAHLGELAGLFDTLHLLPPGDRIQVPAHLEVLFSNLAPIHLHGLVDTGRIEDAVRTLNAWCEHLDLNSLPQAGQRLMQVYEQHIAAHAQRLR